MMVVLAIVGLAAAAVVLTIAPGGADARAEAERLAVRTAALRDRAIVEGRAMAVTISPSGFAFERRAAGQWAVLADGRLKRRDWPDGVRIDGATRVVFNRVGLPDHPAIVRVDTGDSAAVVRIDAAGDVTVE